MQTYVCLGFQLLVIFRWQIVGVKIWYGSCVKDQDTFVVVLYRYISFFPSLFSARVIHALLCTLVASPRVFKKLLWWENETGTSFMSERSALVSWRHSDAGECLARVSLCILCLLLLCKAQYRSHRNSTNCCKYCSFSSYPMPVLSIPCIRCVFKTCCVSLSGINIGITCHCITNFVRHSFCWEARKGISGFMDTEMSFPYSQEPRVWQYE
jgi:hypothetical protein